MRVENTDFLKRNTACAIMLMIILTLAVYANSLKNSFVCDDYYIIVANDFVKSWKNFPAIFSRSYLAPAAEKEYPAMVDLGSGEVTYRPVVTATYFIDYSLWKLNPFGYHLTNLILHISNVILLYFFIGLIAKDKRIALLTGLFFGLHPINSEAVNAIAFREDLLAFLFFISSFILFIKSDYYKSKKKLYCYLGSITLYLLALFSKEMAITLPLLLILYDYYFVFQKNPKKILSSLKSRYLGYIAVLLFYLWVWFLVMSGNIGDFIKDYPGNNLYTNLLTMSRVFATYIIWLLVPIGIHVTMPHDTSYIVSSLFEAEALVSISLIIACFLLAIALRKRAKLLSFAILWFFISLLPVSNILPISNMMASRYLYIPSAGFCLLIAILLHRLPALKTSLIPEALLPRVARDIIIILVIFYSTFTIIRSLTWRNNITLWSEAVEYYPHNAKAHRELGAWFINKGLIDKAIDELKKAIYLDPAYAKSYNNLGVCYYAKGQLDKAIGEFKKLLRLRPDYPHLHTNLGICFIEKKQYKEGIEYLNQAIKANPMDAGIYNLIGTAYANMKNYEQAKKAWEKALMIEPECKDALNNLERLRGLGH